MSRSLYSLKPTLLPVLAVLLMVGAFSGASAAQPAARGNFDDADADHDGHAS